MGGLRELRERTGVKPHMNPRRLPLVAAAAAFVAAVVVFVASFGNWQLYWNRAAGLEGGWSINLRGGRVVASRQHLASSYISMPSTPSWRNGGGFSFERRRFGGTGAVGGKVMAEHLAIPLYPVPLLSGLLLAWRIARWRRLRPPGCCVNCGYDLRATPDRCPECGTVQQGQAANAA